MPPPLTDRLDPSQRAILDALRERFGEGVLPRVSDPATLPPEYWEKTGAMVAQQDQKPSTWERILGRTHEGASRLPAPIGPAIRFAPEIWDEFARPPLERSEDVGQIIGSPIVQGAKEGYGPFDRPDLIGLDYARGGKAFFDNLFADDGVDFRGATEAATDAYDLDPGVAGLSGILFDPLNLIPGRAFTAAPQAATRIGQAAQKGLRSGAAQVGREAVEGVKAMPEALAEDVRDVGRLAGAVGRGVERRIMDRIPVAYAEGPLGERTNLPTRVYRIEEPGTEASDWTKPHGLYTTPSSEESPHKALMAGGAEREWEVNPRARVLTVPEGKGEVAMRRGTTSAGAGVHVVRHLLGATEFDRLRKLRKSALIDEGRRIAPEVDWERYVDSQEVMEGIGGVLARKEGYDAFWVPDEADPSFSEFVALTPRAFVKAAEPPAPSYRDALLSDEGGVDTAQLADDPEVVAALRGRNMRDPGVQEDPAVRDALNKAFARSTAQVETPPAATSETPWTVTSKHEGGRDVHGIAYEGLEVQSPKMGRQEAQDFVGHLNVLRKTLDQYTQEFGVERPQVTWEQAQEIRERMRARTAEEPPAAVAEVPVELSPDNIPEPLPPREPLTAEAGDISLTYQPGLNVPPESAALLQRLQRLVAGGAKSVPKELRDAFAADPWLSQRNIKPHVPPSTRKASMYGSGRYRPAQPVIPETRPPRDDAYAWRKPVAVPDVMFALDRASTLRQEGLREVKLLPDATTDDFQRALEESGRALDAEGRITAHDAFAVVDAYFGGNYVIRKANALSDYLKGKEALQGDKPTGWIKNDELRQLWVEKSGGSRQRARQDVNEQLRLAKVSAGLKRQSPGVRVSDLDEFSMVVARMFTSDDRNLAMRSIEGLGEPDLMPAPAISVGYRTPEGELEALPDFMSMKRGERKKLVKTKAQEYADYQDSLPKTAPPPVIDEAPKIADDIPQIMEQKDIEAAHASQDPMPVDLTPEPGVGPPEVPDAAYREFLERLEALPGERLQNEAGMLRQIAQDPEQLERTIEGARQLAGDEEAVRLQGLLSGGVVPATPPKPVPAAAGAGGSGAGRGNVAAPPPSGAGGNKKKRRPSKWRFGAPPVHGQVQVGGYSFDALPDLDSALAKMRHDSTWQKVADWIGPRFPALVRVVNASGGLAYAPVEAKAAIGVEVLRAEMDAKIIPMFAQLERIGTEDALFGLKDEAGKVAATLANGQETRVFVGQIAENPSSYQLNAQQTEWLRVAQEINQAPKKILEAHGQTVSEYEHDTEFFVGRMIAGKYDSEGNLVKSVYVPMSDKRGLSGRAATVKERTYDSIEDAVKAGFAPEPSYSRTLLMRTRSAGRESVNIRVGHYLAQHLKEAAAGGVEDLRVVPGGNIQRGYGQSDLELLVNTPKKGVQRFIYRVEGPQAERLLDFTQRIAHEGELTRANTAIQALAKAGANIRFLVLTLDLSMLTIQGLASFASRPLAIPRLKLPKVGVKVGDKEAKEVSQSVWYGLKAMLDPDEVRQVRAAIIDEFAQRGGFERHPTLVLDYGGFSELTEAAGGLAGRLEAPIGGGRRLRVGEKLQRASLMFDYVRDILAIKHAELTDEAADKAELVGPAREAFVAAQDSMTNKLLGRLRTQALGIGGSQRAFESGVIGLAPSTTAPPSAYSLSSSMVGYVGTKPRSSSSRRSALWG